MHRGGAEVVLSRRRSGPALIGFRNAPPLARPAGEGTSGSRAADPPVRRGPPVDPEVARDAVEFADELTAERRRRARTAAVAARRASATLAVVDAQSAARDGRATDQGRDVR